MPERYSPPEILTSPLIEKLRLTESYASCVKSLAKTGVLETLRRSQDLGIVGFDGKEYPIPSQEEIARSLIESEKRFETKRAQGFTELVLAPVAMPLETLFKRLENELRTRGEQGRIFAPGDRSKPLEVQKGIGNDDGPLYRWDEFEKGDVNETLLYYPKRYAQDTSEGMTKKQLMGTLSFPGWIVELQEAGDIPAQGKGATQEGRTKLEANQSPNDYLAALHSMKENGMTVEGWIARFFKSLEERDEAIDDFRGIGKLCYLLGNYTSSG
ncbi:MAG: hypothetical protein Q7K26_02525, partial [bacterium]|nr:hypothetical protein [bacterium]